MSDRVVGFLSGSTQTGRWIPPAEITAMGIMGGSTVDLSQAIFTHPVITIRSKAFWGGVTVVVPPNVDVEQNGTAIMGSFGDGSGLYSSSSGSIAQQTTPTTGHIKVVLEGWGIMGGVSVIINPLVAPAQLFTPEQANEILGKSKQPGATMEVEVTVPEGNAATPGSLIPVTVHGKELFVPIPEGAKPGTTFKATVPYVPEGQPYSPADLVHHLVQQKIQEKLGAAGISR